MAALGFGLIGAIVALLWSFPQSEGSACGGVSVLGLPYIDPASPPDVWKEAIARPGYMQRIDVASGRGRFRYIDASTGVMEQFYFQGQTQPWNAQNTRAVCVDWNAIPGYSCRFFEELPARYGYVIFEQFYELEIGRERVSTDVIVNQDNKTWLEIYPPQADDLEGAECALGEMLWRLRGEG